MVRKHQHCILKRFVKYHNSILTLFSLVDESQMEEGKVDDQKMNEDRAPGDNAINAPKIEKPLIAEMKEKDEKVDENVMNDKMSEENGAKRIKEECICPVLGKSCSYLFSLCFRNGS